jgi:iron complex transport system permease protein
VDTVARMALAPVDVATGLVTALVGGPVFAWLVTARL